jgi:hypothetical protein
VAHRVDAELAVQRRLVGDEDEAGRVGAAVRQRDRRVARRAAGVGLGQGEVLGVVGLEDRDLLLRAGSPR